LSGRPAMRGAQKLRKSPCSLGVTLRRFACP
jgi:hypothetical protein